MLGQDLLVMPPGGALYVTGDCKLALFFSGVGVESLWAPGQDFLTGVSPTLLAGGFVVATSPKALEFAA